jgi:hypothetical protein
MHPRRYWLDYDPVALAVLVIGIAQSCLQLPRRGRKMAIPLGQFVEQQAAIAGRNGRESGMVTRLAMVFLILLAAGSACAESLTPDAARRFVTGKLFAFNCFDGSRGAGRIYGDGSVIGTIQFRGAGPARTVSLPAGTLRVRGEAVCASLQGMAFEPRLVDGLCLLRLHAAHERRRHEPAPTFVRAAIARGGSGVGGPQLILRHRINAERERAR